MKQHRPIDSHEARIMEIEDRTKKTTEGTKVSAVKKACGICPSKNDCPFAGFSFSSKEGLCAKYRSLAQKISSPCFGCRFNDRCPFPNLDTFKMEFFFCPKQKKSGSLYATPETRDGLKKIYIN